jgi:hypothetical protein
MGKNPCTPALSPADRLWWLIRGETPTLFNPCTSCRGAGVRKGLEKLADPLLERLGEQKCKGARVFPMYLGGKEKDGLF